MADTSREQTPAPDEAYIATVPPEFSQTTTELELLLTNPDSLLHPPRYQLDDLHSKRVIFRLRHYMVLLRTNDAIWKRCTDDIGRILHQRGAEFGPPPQWPFNDAAWHQWLLQKPPTTLAPHEMFDLGPMPLPVPWDHRPPFKTPLELIEHLDATWETAASRWGIVAESAIDRAEEEVARARARATQLRDERTGRLSDESDAGPTASDESIELVLGHLNAAAVYLRDPQAPSLRRHCYYTSYALFPAPQEPSALPELRIRFRPRDLIYIRTNVDYIPPLPPRILALLRTDGFYGPHEISRWAQWHEVGFWHHAFIPLGRRDGRAHLNAHSDLRGSVGDIAWYVPDFAQHFKLCGNGYYIMDEKLAFELDYAWNRDRKNLETSRDDYPSLIGQPYQALDTGRRALNLLRSHQLSERDIVETMASFQRCLLEIRGWNEFVRCRIWLKNFQRKLNNPSILPPADARDPKTRRWARGVFTHSAEIAMRYGQYGVPVWLVQVVPHGFVPPANHFVPEGPVVVTETLRSRYACEAWNNVRPPPHLAAVQEPGFVLQPKQAGTQDAPPPEDDEDRAPHDDEDVVMFDEPPPQDESAPPNEEQRPPPPQGESAPPNEVRLPRPPQDDKPAQPNEQPRVPENDKPAPPNDETREPRGEAVRHEQDVAINNEADASRRSSKKRKRNNGKDKDTLDSAGNTTKPAKRQKGEGSSKTQKSAQQEPKFKFPYARRNKPLPDWWPKTWAAATTALANTIGRDAGRLAQLGSAPDYPVDAMANPGRLVRVPIMEQFYGKKDELKTSRMILHWLRMRGARMRSFATVPIRDVYAWNAEDWRKISSANVHPSLQPSFARKLGFDLDPPAERILIQEPEAPQPLQFEIPSRLPSPGASSSMSTASAPPSTAPSTPPTTRPSTANPDLQHTAGEDSDGEDMTRVDASGRRLPPDNTCFVPMENGRANDGTLLAREDERYLKEPPGWRFKAPGQHRAYREFALFVDEAPGDDGILEFRAIGENGRKQYMEGYAEFWDYEGGRILFVMDPVGQRRGGGENMTKPIRLMPMQGSRAKASDPVQLRVWPAQSLQSKLYVPRDALGAVGSRARTERFRLSDADYAKVFPGAPLPSTPSASTTESTAGGVAPTMHPEAEAQSASSVVAATSSATPASNDACESNSAAPLTVASRASSPVRPDAGEGAKPDAPVVQSRADHWVAQGWISVADKGAPTPLHDLLAPEGDIFFNGHVLPPFADNPPPSYAWPSGEWRTHIFWDLAELTFRTALFALDDHMRRTYPDLNVESELARQQMICEIWGDTSFVPDGRNPLTAPDWRERVDAIRAFHRVASSWPRTTFSLPADWTSEADFLAFEGSVWLAYTQTYSDYFSREPPVPLVYPDHVPWDSAPE